MRRPDERGLATVVGVAFVGLLVVTTIAVTYAVAAVAAHRRAQAAADLAALAGAAALQDGGQECGRAAELARRNAARLTGCSVAGWTVQVRVAVRLDLPLVGGVDLPARSLAGPTSALPSSSGPSQSVVSR